MTLEMGYTPGYADASSETLKTRQTALLAEADRIAALAYQAPTHWQQLQIVHDHLIRNTVYDTTLDQTTNNAASALLDHLTLCQGYAQSFQLITQKLASPSPSYRFLEGVDMPGTWSGSTASPTTSTSPTTIPSPTAVKTTSPPTSTSSAPMP